MYGILLAVESSPFLTKFVYLAMLIVAIGFVLRLLRQPHVIIYIIIGIIMGPSLLKLTTDMSLIEDLGSLGLVLMLFFIGMEISVKQFLNNWKISVVGTLIQVVFSILALALIGFYYEWGMARIITLGFVISLSSTAVIIKLLESRGELNSRQGQNALGILLVQDVLIVPMLIVLSYLGGKTPSGTDILMQVIGGIIVLSIVVYVVWKGTIKMPFHNLLRKDHEMQIFFSFLICFGFAAMTGYFGISTALGAFVAGIIVSATKSTNWFHDSLHSLKVIFVALFFISIGMLIDLDFLREHMGIISILLVSVFVINSLINTLVLRFFKQSWAVSFYTGALLSQIGEFGFIIGATAYFNGIVNEFTYQIMISVISLSLLLSPAWVNLSLLIFRKALARNIQS